MNEMMDQLEQVIEERVMQLKGKMEEEKSQTDQAEKEEYIMHVERILNSLSEEEREWLDDQMMKKLDVPNQERLRLLQGRAGRCYRSDALLEDLILDKGAAVRAAACSGSRERRM